MHSFIYRRIFSTIELSSVPRYAKFSSATFPNSSVDEEEIRRFAGLADSWWSECGPMKALRSMNRLRVPWIRDTLLQVRRQNGHDINPDSTFPLNGLRVLDVGCGAGFLTEPLARLGANVTGIDPTIENIEVAKEHANRKKDELGYGQRLVYYSKTVEDLVEEAKVSIDEKGYDAVIASEVVEHVSNRELFVDNCLRLVKSNGGCVFFTTINRTVTSRLLAIFVAENILRIVPPGVHEYDKFVTPDDLQFLVEKNGDFCVRLVHGMLYNPLTNQWSWTRNTSVNYALSAVKK